MPGFAWTENQQRALAEMAAAGKTAKQVATILGGTRNAILGRAHRTGVKFHGNPPPAPKPPRQKAGPRAPRGAWVAHRDAVRDLYLQGLKLTAIAERVGVPIGSIGGLVRDLPRRRETNWSASKYSREFKLTALSMTFAGVSGPKVCKRLGYSYPSHRNWLKDAALVAEAKAIGGLVRAEHEAKRRARAEEARRRAAMIKAYRDAHNAPILAKLAPRDAIICGRVCDGETLQEVGDDYGITRERVRQIVTRARIAYGLDTDDRIKGKSAGYVPTGNRAGRPKKAPKSAARKTYTISDVERQRRADRMRSVAAIRWGKTVEVSA